MVTIPELNLIGRDDVRNGDKWVVRETRPVRGLPRTSVEGKEMHIPLGEDEKSRCIRAHEMIHAKISPNTEDMRGWLSRQQASEKALIVAEESRVNYLAHLLGYPMQTAMADGREELDAIDAATQNDWENLVAAAVAGTFTAGEKKWVSGSKQVNPRMAAQLENIIAEVREYWDTRARYVYGLTEDDVSKNRRSELSEIVERDEWTKKMNAKILAGEAPALDEDGEPQYASDNRGFLFTEELAKRIDIWKQAGDLVEISGDGDNIVEMLEDDNGTGLNNKPVWDTLRFWPAKPMRSVPGAVSRKRIAMNTGKYPRRVERLLSDPERRIFDHVKKSSGGVVLIDGSGSMSWGADDIEHMVLAAPGCTVAVYSAPDEPNWYGNEDYVKHTMFVLAQGGKTLSRAQITEAQLNLCGGNGCDLPALKWAISQRSNNKQPLIWVTDGFIHGLDSEVIRTARIAAANDVMYARTGSEAVDLLRQLKSKRRVKTEMPEGFRNAAQIFRSASGRRTLLGPTVE